MRPGRRPGPESAARFSEVMTVARNEQPGDIVLTLRTTASSVPMPTRLKRLLKTCLRSFSFRAVDVRQVLEDQGSEPQEPADVDGDGTAGGTA